MQRIKTEYPGVYYREVKRLGGKGMERVYYIVFKKNGKVYEEKIGRHHADKLTPARVNTIRSDRIEGRRKSRKEIREEEKAKDRVWTVSRLWDEYETQKADSKAIHTDKGRFEKYLKPALGNKQPHEIVRLDVDRIRISLSKKLKPQSVKHVLALLKRVVNFGVRRQLCKGLSFQIEVPKVDNQKTEDLTPEQMKRLLAAISESTDIQAASIMKLALFTGMRRGEIFHLKWDDIDFERGFISIRNPKGGVSQKIPLNEQARAVLENHPRTAENVFVRKDGKPFTDIRRRVNPIKKAAGIPEDFRALHGLRHTYASMLASSGQVDMYTLQKLLTHKSPLMTQRYAHLRDDVLKRASALAGSIIDDAVKVSEEESSAEEEKKAKNIS
jgi:integrase